MSNSLRRKKINELLKREIGKIILKEGDFSKNVLITITQVQTFKDFKKANVFLMVLPEEKTEEVLNFFNKKIWFLQQKLNKKLFMRPVPKIKFYKDERLKIAQKIEKILRKI